MMKRFPLSFTDELPQRLRALTLLVQVNIKALLRDRILHAITAAILALLLLVPLVSGFSMRQVQELAISLSLSGVSLFLLAVAVFFGSSSIWSDIEHRYTTTVLTLPLSRAGYVLAKFASIGLFLTVIGVLLGGCALGVVYFAAAAYPSEQPLIIANFVLAVAGDVLKSLMVAAIALLLSSLSTSLYLPFFGTIVLYLCGSASQEVFEYVTGEFGRTLPVATVNAIRFVYYLLPNLSALDFKVHAVYGLPVEAKQVYYGLGYGVVYISILVTMAVKVFQRRVL